MRSFRRLAPALLAFLAVLAACASSTPAENAVWLERRVMLMGTSLDLVIAAVDRERALAASERAVAALEAAEARLSTWREDTELARLNRAPAGRPQPLSPELAADLGAARRCWEETAGAFDPAIAPLIAAWGLRQGGRLPSEVERREALAASGMDGLRLESIGSDSAAVRGRPDLAIEEGGFGKGAGLADAVEALAEVPGVAGASLDFGGQVAVLGAGAHGSWGEWKVEVADPRRRDRPVVALSIPWGSVSTSGNSERGITVEGRRLGHILDPRTGEPAPDFGSVTVWTADPLRADCLSTGLYVMGPEAALAWAVGRPDVEVLVLRPPQDGGDGLEALATQGLRGRIEPLSREIRVVFGA
jgi:thiamine biosynthesis lipoprotein